MVYERISKLSPFVRQASERIESVSTGSAATTHSSTGDVESPQRVPTIGDGAQMSNSSLLTSSSASHSLRRSPRHRDVYNVDEDSSSGESSSVVEIMNPKRSPTKNPVRSSRRLPVSSKHINAGGSPVRSSSKPKPRVGARAGPFPRSPNKAALKPPSAGVLQSRSGRPFPVTDKPSVSKEPEAHRRASLDVRDVSNPKPQCQPSPSPATLEASTSRVDIEDLPVFAYDLDNDPTEEVHVLHYQFQERSPHSAFLSARFIQARLLERPSGLTTPNNELTNSEGDLVTEFINLTAVGSVGPHNEVTPSYSVDSVDMLRNSHPSPPGNGDVDLEGTAHLADPFPPMTMDDVINQPGIDPAFLEGAPVFSEPRQPSPAPTPFRNFHSGQNARLSSPPTLSVRIPLASTSTSNSANTPRDSAGKPSGGKPRFYRKGKVQTPPHRSISQSQKGKSAKATPSTHPSRLPSLARNLSLEIESPLTEFTASDMNVNGAALTWPVTTPSEAANTADEETTVIGSGTSTSSPRVFSVKTTTEQKQKNNINAKGPYRIVAANGDTNCHQCRRTTSHPKMKCRNCTKGYCILCIVKRYHDIEFHQFKNDFDCPACLNNCNCTCCCDKRKEVYVTTRHIKFNAEMMSKLLSGEARSLSQLTALFPGSRKGFGPRPDSISSSRRELPSTTRKAKAPTRRKRGPSRRYASDDDDGHDDGDDDDDYGDGDTWKAQSARVKPDQAALQTHRMLEESGSGRYWGAVYSLSGERVGMSYVGDNLRNVTVKPAGSSSVRTRGYSSFQRRVYLGKWQDAWGPRPETCDDSFSEGETYASRRSRGRKDPGRARFHYVGNQSIIKAWRRAQSKAVKPPVSPPPYDVIDVDAPSSDSLPFVNHCDYPEATNAPPNVILIDEEDEDSSRGYWAMEDALSPKETNSLFTPIGYGLSEVNDVLDVCSPSPIGSCEQLVPQQALADVVASSLEAVGTAVLLPPPPLSLSTFSC